VEDLLEDSKILHSGEGGDRAVART